MCFGYAAIVHQRGNRYAFLEELAECTVDMVSIEAAQPKLDLAPVGTLLKAGKTIVLGTLDLGDPRVETADDVRERIEHALEYVAPERLIVAPDCGMKYLPRTSAFGKLRAMVEGAARVREQL
jgi:5-methyltetrahydropteroyltriglutamate--homocysteine methyltransferase